MSCEMTTRHTSLAAAIVAVQQLDGVALHAGPPHRLGRPSGGLVTRHGTRETHTTTCAVS